MSEMSAAPQIRVHDRWLRVYRHESVVVTGRGVTDPERALCRAVSTEVRIAGYPVVMPKV